MKRFYNINKVFSLFLQLIVLWVGRVSIGRLFRATLNAHSTKLSLVRGMNTSSFLANRRTARREESPEAGCGKLEI